MTGGDNGGDAVPVLIALGSNLGDRRANLDRALAQLPPDIVVQARSAIYETAPMYVTKQPGFYNMAVAGRTALSPRRLLHRLQGIETAVGRVPGPRNGPRLIDLDIIYYADRQVREADLIIPHARVQERAFVLVPLADIAADHRDPRSGLTVARMLADLPQSPGVEAPRRLDI